MRFSGLTILRHTQETGNLIANCNLITRSRVQAGNHVISPGRSFEFLSTKPHDDALIAAQLSALNVPYIQVSGSISPKKEEAFRTAVAPIIQQLNLLG